MASLNRVEAIGNLGADAETRYLPSGKPVSSFRIACNERWTDRETKEKKERTEWIPCVLFGQEKVLQYLTKGKQVFLEGKFVTEKWEDKEGVTRWSTRVYVHRIQLLGSSNGTARQPDAPLPGVDDSDPYGAPVPDDDIPF